MYTGLAGFSVNAYSSSSGTYAYSVDIYTYGNGYKQRDDFSHSNYGYAFQVYSYYLKFIPVV